LQKVHNQGLPEMIFSQFKTSPHQWGLSLSTVTLKNIWYNLYMKDQDDLLYWRKGELSMYRYPKKKPTWLECKYCGELVEKFSVKKEVVCFNCRKENNRHRAYEKSKIKKKV